MGFAAASVLPLKHYADFRGRSTRTEVAGFYVLTAVVTIAVISLAGWLGQDAAKPWLEVGLAVIFLPPTLALYVRRLHDWGRSGWWLLVASPFPAAFFWELVNYPPHPFTLHLKSHLPWWVIVPVVLCVLASYALLFWPDDLDTNRYGPNPRGWTAPVGEPA